MDPGFHGEFHGDAALLKTVKPEILVGIDLWHEFDITPLRQLSNGFIISQSRLGEFISGRGIVCAPCLEINENVYAPSEIAALEPEFEKKLSDFFSLERIGLVDEDARDDEILENFKRDLVIPVRVTKLVFHGTPT